MSDLPEDFQFDEDAYLARYPDVLQAVAERKFTSGRHHYVTFGRKENRRADSLDEKAPAVFPPEHLRSRVHGASDLDSYLRVGKTVASNLFDLEASEAVTIPETARVLDFGCGPGRIITWLRNGRPGWRFHGTDIDPEAIEWAASNIADIGAFEVNAAMPPLRYTDNFFDFIYSISIFTHLPEDMQDVWLAELARVAKSGAYLALTTHGLNLLPQAMKSPEGGFSYAVGSGTDGLPEFYQSSCQSPDYVRRNWSRHFVIKKVLPAGLNGHQDIVICRKP